MGTNTAFLKGQVNQHTKITFKCLNCSHVQQVYIWEVVETHERAINIHQEAVKFTSNCRGLLRGKSLSLGPGY